MEENGKNMIKYVKTRDSETYIHTSIINYLKLQYKDALYTSTMGGVYLGKKNYRQKKIMNTHYRKGVPDLLIFEPRGDFNGLMIEIKTKRGKVSKYQKEWNNMLNKRGYLALITYGFEEAKNKIDKYLKYGES